MTTFRFDISMSLDGFIAGPNQSIDDPLGERLLAGGIVLQIVGWFAINRIVNVEY